MKIPRKLKKRLKKIGAYEELKLLLNPTLEKMAKTLENEEKLCECCWYETVCSGGVSGGPNGPIFPPCCDGFCFDHEAIYENYYNWLKERMFKMLKEG